MGREVRRVDLEDEERADGASVRAARVSIGSRTEANPWTVDSKGRCSSKCINVQDARRR